MVFTAATRARLEPASISSSTRFGFFSYSTRRSRIGAIHLIKLSAMAALHSMQPMPAVRQPSADHFSVSGGENSLCQSYTGHTSGFPGSLRRFLAGSVIIVRVLVRIERLDSLSAIEL